MDSLNKNNVDQLDLVKNISENSDLYEKDSVFSELNQKVRLFNSILIVDTETTGLDEDKNEVIEIGCILFHIPSKSVLSQLSFLLPVNLNEAEHINKISVEVSKVSQPWRDSLNLFLKLVETSDLLVAHNVAFDKKWFGKGLLPPLDKKWLCSLDDINWSFMKNLKSRPSVTDLALAFDIPVWNLHRALSDCYYLSEVFKRIDNLEFVLSQALEPRYLYKAIVSYENRLLAKNAGFSWNNHVQGAWTKKLSEQEASELDFRVQIIN